MAVTRRVAALFVALAWGMFAPAAELAAADDTTIFSVVGIAVDATADEAAAARAKARVEGQRQALNRLLARIVPYADHGLLPNFDDATITDLVRAFEVSDERVAPNRYIASLTFHFKPDAIGQLLRKEGISYAVTPGRPVVVLPVYRGMGELLLWADNNPWRAVWSNLLPSDGLLPVIVPIGELADITLLDARQAAAGKRDLLDRLARRYDASEVVVVEAELERDTLMDAPTVGVVVRRYQEEGVRIGGGTYSGGSRAALDSVLLEAARATRAQLEEEWKEANLLHFDRAQNVAVDIPVIGLEDWLDIHRRLSGLALVRKVEIAALSPRFARVILHYLGDSRQLVAGLANEGLDLDREADLWILRRHTGEAGRNVASEIEKTSAGSDSE